MPRRTPETFQDHLDHVVSQCCTRWLVLQTLTLLGPEYIITPQLCKSNYCPTCRAHNLRRLRQALYISLRKKQWRLVTLTYPDHTLDKLDVLKNTARQFKRLVQRLRRRYPHLTFVRTIELHESDFPHIHFIVDRYVTKSLLSKHWHDLGGGIVDVHAYAKCPVCGVRGKCQHNPHPKPLSYRTAANYLTDEIEKENQDPHRLGLVYWLAHIRSITTSRNLKLIPPKNEWKFYGVFDELSTACDNVFFMQRHGPNEPRPQLTTAEMKDGLYVGYGFHT
jgi:hypothetical protein